MPIFFSVMPGQFSVFVGRSSTKQSLDKVFCLRTRHSALGESRTSNLSVPIPTEQRYSKFYATVLDRTISEYMTKYMKSKDSDPILISVFAVRIENL